MRRRRLALVVVPVVAVLLTGGVAFVRSQPWREGSVHGPWLTVFTGYGRVHGDDQALELSPRPASTSERTHAALVVSTFASGDLTLTAEVRTHSQLRRGDPNAWEVGWVLWHYTSPARFYALALKPNGWELTKQDPAAPGGQRFLTTGAQPVFPVGGTYHLSIVQVGPVIKVSAEGHLLASYTDDPEPYLRGRVGFYTEDASVSFSKIHVTDVDTAQSKGTNP